jgi:hypothetical protein
MLIYSKLLGERIHLIEDDEELPPDDGLVVYRHREIVLLSGCPLVMLEPIHHAKKVFGTEVENEL